MWLKLKKNDTRACVAIQIVYLGDGQCCVCTKHNFWNYCCVLMGIGHINGVNGFELFFVGVTLLYHKNRAIYVHASYLFYFFFF